MKPLIVDPPRKGHNINDLSTRDTARGPKKLPSLYFQYIDNLREEDNLSTKDKTSEFILSPTCPLFGGFTVVESRILTAQSTRPQEMVMDKSPDGSIRPRYLIYDVMQIEVSASVDIS